MDGGKAGALHFTGEVEWGQRVFRLSEGNSDVTVQVNGDGSGEHLGQTRIFSRTQRTGEEGGGARGEEITA